MTISATPGMPDYDVLRKAFSSGYVPEVRIWLQEIGPDGRAGPMMRRLEHQTHVSVQRDIIGGGSAVIALSNRDDRFFRKRFKRAEKLGDEGRDYITDIMGRCWHHAGPINPDRVRHSAFEGVRSFATQDDIDDYLNFLFDFSGVNTRRDGNDLAFSGGPGVVGPDAPSGRGHRAPLYDRDLVDLGLMQRIAIDAKGQDGQWYAWFTGVVTGIDDGYRVQDVPTIAIRCRDYMRILQLSEIVVRAGPGASELSNRSFEFRLQSELHGRPLASFCTSLADMTGSQILHFVLDQANRTYCWLPYAMWRLGLGGYRYDDDAFSKAGKAVPGSIKRNFFWHDEGFWYVPFFSGTDEVGSSNKTQRLIQPTYLGQTTLRKWVDRIHVYDKDSIESTTVNSVNPGRPTDTMDSFKVAALDSTLLIDANLESGLQGDAYRFLIESFLGLYQIDRTTSDQVIRKVADATFYDIFFDGNGSLVYQIPKYNNLPGDYNVTFKKRRLVSTVFALNRDDLMAQQIPVVTEAQSFEIPETNTVRYGKGMQDPGPAEEGGTSGTHFDFAPDGLNGTNFAWRFHGYNYILTNVGMRSWTLSSAEEPIVTNVEVPGGFGIIKSLGAVADALQLTGRTSMAVESVRSLQARFGNRFLRVSQVNLPRDFRGLGANVTPILDSFAQAVMQQFNGKAVTGTVEMSSRSDLDLGLTVLHLERQHVFYVTGIQHQVRYGRGADATTVLQLSYGHDLAQQIPNPWQVAGEALTVLKIPSSEFIKSIRVSIKDANGETISDDLIETTSDVANTAGLAFGGESVAGQPTGVKILDPSGRFEKATPQGLRGFKALQDALGTMSSELLTKSKLIAMPTHPNVLFEEREPGTMMALAKAKAAQIGLGHCPEVMDVEHYTLARVIASEATNRIGVLEPGDLDSNAENRLMQQLIAGYLIWFDGQRSSITGVATRSKLFRLSPPRGPNGAYANQQDVRRVATSKDPTAKHLFVAKWIIENTVASPIPPKCNFFSPKSQKAIRIGTKTRPPVPKTKASSVVVAAWYEGGVAWLDIPGLNASEKMVFAPGPTKANGNVNLYGTKSKEEALAFVKKWDS